MNNGFDISVTLSVNLEWWQYKILLNDSVQYKSIGIEQQNVWMLYM